MGYGHVVLMAALCCIPVQAEFVHTFQEDATSAVHIRNSSMDTNNTESSDTLQFSSLDQRNYERDKNCPEKCSCQWISDTELCLQCAKDITDSDLKAFLAEKPQITSLSFQHSYLKVVPAALCELPNLQMLNLDYNRIHHIGDFNLSCFEALTHLSAANNSLEMLAPYLLDGLDNLEYISLAFNKIHSVDSWTFRQPHLKKLVSVQLDHNRMTIWDAWMFRIPAFLDHLHVRVNLSENMISKIINTVDFHVKEVHRSQMIYIDLRANQLKHVGDFKTIFKFKSWTDALGTWNCGFDFHFNPFDCDCDMFHLIDFLRPFIPFFKIFTDLYFIQVHCKTPPEANGKLIYKLPNNVFRCFINESCPADAKCIHTPGNNTVTILNTNNDVTSLPSKVPNETHVQMFYPNTQVDTLSARPYMKNITTLDLAKSRLSTIHDDVVPQLQNVQVINFQECCLTILPPKMTDANFTKLTSIDLVGNPFRCDCYMPAMKQWLQRHETALQEKDMLQCNNVPFAGRQILKVPDRYMICDYLTLFIVTSVILLYIFLILLWLICHNCKRRIHLQLLKTFDLRFTLWSSKTPRELRHHITVYVAEDDQNSPLVDAICQLIENQAPNLTLHRLGYQLGSPKLEIAQRLPESEGCLFFMSSHTVQSNLCTFCFMVAIDMFIRYYHSMFLIPVLLEPKNVLVMSSHIPADTKSFLRLFDSVDVSSSSQNLLPVFFELQRLMKLQVQDFPHTLAEPPMALNINMSNDDANPASSANSVPDEEESRNMQDILCIINDRTPLVEHDEERDKNVGVAVERLVAQDSDYGTESGHNLPPLDSDSE